MDNVCFKAKKCVGKEMHFLANSKKTQSLEKMAVDKSAWIKACMYMYIYIYIYK